MKNVFPRQLSFMSYFSLFHYRISYFFWSKIVINKQLITICDRFFKIVTVIFFSRISLVFLTENYDRHTVGHNLWLNLWPIFQNCDRNIFSQISLIFWPKIVTYTQLVTVYDRICDRFSKILIEIFFHGFFSTFYTLYDQKVG